MSRCEYTVNTYGIAIPEHSVEYYYVLEKLKTLHPDYFNDGQDEFEHLYYINDIEPNITHHHNIDIYELENFNNLESITVSDAHPILVLHGNHEKPTLISSPFKTTDECVNHYKNQFGNILPDDFDYENTIGKIYIEAWD